MSLNSTPQKVSRGRISPQSHGHRILGFWRNCTDWLPGTWQNYYRNILRWSDYKMSRSTEREETRKVATRCAMSSPANTSSQALTAIWIAGFKLLATHRIWQIWTPLTSICCKTEKKSMERRKFIDDNDVICTANGCLEDKDQEFYNGIRALENRWTQCISVKGDYCWKVTKYHAHILLLTMSGYELFERPSYVPNCKILHWISFKQMWDSPLTNHWATGDSLKQTLILTTLSI